MNKIFRIVWNKSLRQFMVASELARSSRPSCTVDRRHGMNLSGMLARGALAAALLAAAPLALAHTTSVGYVAPLGTSHTVTFWYGTYHTVADDGVSPITFEGQFQLTGVDNSFSQTVNFSQIVGARQTDPNRPFGLEDGVNNFYGVSSTGTTLVATPPGNGPGATWQGVTFTGLAPGTYTYTYIPIANPSTVWDPWQAVLSNTLVVTAADLNGFPLLSGHTYTQTDPELNQSDSIVFNGGTYAPTTDTTNGQAVTLRSGGGTVDTSGGDVTLTGGVDGTGTLTKTGTGTLTLDGTSSYTGGTLVQQGTLRGDTDSLKGTIANDGTVDFNQSTDGTYTGAMSGSGNLVKDGYGTLVLTGSNTYTGGTTVNGGTLAGNTGSLQGNIANDGTVDFNQSSDGTYTGAMSGSGNLVKDGYGTLVLTGSNTYTGGTTVNGGALAGNTGSLQGNIANDGTVDFNQSSDGTYTGAMSGSGTLVKDGNGTLVLTGSNTYTGGTTVNGGTLAGNTGSLQGDITNNGTVDFDQASDGTYAGRMGGSGGLVKDGSGTLVLTGSNTYGGGTTINAGTLEVSNDANLGAAGGSLTLNGGTLHTTGDVTGNRGIVLAGDGTIATDAGTTLAAGGTVSGSGTLVKNGTGTLQLDGIASHSGGTTVNGGTLVFTGSNTYTGGTTLNGGTLQIGSDAGLGDASGGLNFHGGTLHTTASLTTGRDIQLAGEGRLDVDNGTTLTASHAITGAGTLVKQGSGTLVLTGANAYTGGTTVAGGVLQGDSTSLQGNITNDGIVDFQQSTDGSYAGSMGGSGTLVKDGGGTLAIGGALAQAGGTVVNDGTLVLTGNNTYRGGTTLNGGSLVTGSDASLGDASGTLTFNGGDLTVTQSMASSRNMLINAGNASITTLAGATFTAHGDMSGTGGLVKRGDGTLVVTGNNDFTGGTLIDGGVIRIDSGSSLGTGVIVLQGGTLQTVATLGSGQTVLVSGNSGVNTDAGTTTSLSGQILTTGASGCFVKSGKGTLNMTGAATLANGTCVQEGMLRANGELTSQVQVDTIGTLRGVGRVTGSVNVEGMLAPGNSPGTLTVSDAVTMHAGSALQIDIDGTGTGTGAGNYSRLLVGGSFTAAGTLAPTLRGITGNASNAFTPALGDVYTVVQAAGGVVGTFDALAQPIAGMAANTRFQVFYVGGKAVELFVTPASYATLLAGANGNAVHAGGAVDRMVAAQDAGADTAAQHGLLYAVAGLRAAALPQFMQDLAGEAHAQAAAMAREAGLGLAADMGGHLAESSLDQGEHANRAWATLSQGGYRALSDAQASGFHSQQSRASAGLDAYRGDAVLVGVGLAHTEARLEDTPASGNVRGNAAMVYGELAAGRALLDGTASWSKDRWSTRRADPLAPASSLSSQADGHSMVASVTARLPLRHDGLRIEPYVQALWQRVDRDGFTESGDASSQLSVGRYSAAGTRLLAGLRLGSAAQDPLAATVTYRLGAAVGRDFGDSLNPVLDATLAGETYRLQAPTMGRTLLKLDANGTLRLGKRTYLYGGLESATGHDRAGYGVNAGVRVQF